MSCQPIKLHLYQRAHTFSRAGPRVLLWAFRRAEIETSERARWGARMTAAARVEMGYFVCRRNVRPPPPLILILVKQSHCTCVLLFSHVCSKHWSKILPQVDYAQPSMSPPPTHTHTHSTFTSTENILTMEPADNTINIWAVAMIYHNKWTDPKMYIKSYTCTS